MHALKVSMSNKTAWNGVARQLNFSEQRRWSWPWGMHTWLASLLPYCTLLALDYIWSECRLGKGSPLPCLRVTNEGDKIYKLERHGWIKRSKPCTHHECIVIHSSQKATHFYTLDWHRTRVSSPYCCCRVTINPLKRSYSIPNSVIHTHILHRRDLCSRSFSLQWKILSASSLEWVTVKHVIIAGIEKKAHHPNSLLLSSTAAQAVVVQHSHLLIRLNAHLYLPYGHKNSS